ncbi:RpoE-regulated lipoprotein [Xenorhabdus sp. KK7.4]|uniref:RpoE-regulated lipoprotein n=1 Tax=Xenorhabdus sp. KK7.4 TaxID=1851572 RepID=UPI000C041A22|nr:RpoE-regulated lipoprotein [Xenorhabdus sp. KK7.4]PHM51762.1 RpoE-regulated lipoprotein [Xenorhabdus sp. KK7.4]
MKRYFLFSLLFKKRIMAFSGLIGSSLLLTACAGTSGLSWSSLSPLNWFSRTLEVSEQGVGEINKQTDMKLSAIQQGLDNRYRLRSGMEMKNGKFFSVIQGIEGDQVRIELSGLNHGKVAHIIILDEGIKTTWGTKIGTSFSTLYDKAYGACLRSDDIITMQQEIVCIAPQSRNISYVFTGTWNGSEELLPPDDVLKTWKISRIIWKAN